MNATTPLHQRMVEYEIARHADALAELSRSIVALHALQPWLAKAEAAGIEFSLHQGCLIPARARRQIACLVMLAEGKKKGAHSDGLYTTLIGFGFVEVAREKYSFADYVELLAPDSHYGVELEVTCGLNAPALSHEVAA